MEDFIDFKAIRERFFPEFCAASHLDDVVFDVIVRVKTRGSERETQVKLLEINPFFEMTDPCLFDWRRLIEAGTEPVRLELSR